MGTKQNFREIVSSSSKIGNRKDAFQELGEIRMEGNINISHPQKNGNIFGEFRYNNIDSLHIQFKDLLGRQVAQLELYEDNFSLWLQREDKRLSGKKLPPDYSYLTLNNKITIPELRKILLGVPISDSILKEEENDPNISKFISDKELIASSKVNKTHKYIKRVTFSESENKIGKVLYTEYDSKSNILIPSKIIIEHYNGPYKVKIKITKIDFENTPIT